MTEDIYDHISKLSDQFQYGIEKATGKKCIVAWVVDMNDGTVMSDFSFNPKTPEESLDMMSLSLIHYLTCTHDGTIDFDS